MNKTIIKKIVFIVATFLISINFSHADKSIILNKSGYVGDIRFEKEEGFGKIYYKNEPILNGVELFLNGKPITEKINIVSINKLSDRYYLTVCSGLCRSYFIFNDGKVKETSFGGRYGIGYIYETDDGKYLIGVSYFYEEEGDGTLNLYDKTKEEVVGNKYIKNVEENIKDIATEGSTIKIAKKDGTIETYSINNFTKTSLQEDYEKMDKEYARKERMEKVFNFLKKYYLYIIGVVAVLLGIRIYKAKTTRE